LVRRRNVLYIEGYDPQGAAGYYRLFRRECQRFSKVWPVAVELGQLHLDSPALAHWVIETTGPNWQVSTRYDFLRQEDVLSANMRQPMLRQIARMLKWLADDLVSGALLRIFRASWRFALHLVYFQLMLLIWMAMAGAIGWAVAAAGWYLVGGPLIIYVFAGPAVAGLAFTLLRPLADRLFIVQIINCWPYLREYARGEPTGFDPRIESGAAHQVRLAHNSDSDEIVIIAHSGGGALAPAVMSRALELDPDLGRHGTPVILLTLGSIMPGVALHPGAIRLREMVHRIAVEPSVLWIDCQSRKDIMNFWDFDPVEGVGVKVGPDRCNPLVWQVRFRDAVSDQFYQRLRRSFFRLHYQFIMAGDQRAPYDYFMLVGGPALVAHWAQRGREMLAAFGCDGSYLPALALAPMSPVDRLALAPVDCKSAIR
jgi:hypothetical protein